MEFVSGYLQSPGLRGGLGFIEAESAEDAMAQLQERMPNCLEYAVQTRHCEWVHEDWPALVQWSEVGSADLVPLVKENCLAEHFLAWTQKLGYIRHTPEQEALKVLRREVKAWAKTGKSPDPRFTWLAVYRCGIGDWDTELTLTRVSAEARSRFLDFVAQVEAIAGQRPIIDHVDEADFWTLYRQWDYCPSEEEALESKSDLEDVLQSHFIKIHPHAISIKRASDDYFVCLLKQTYAVWEESCSARQSLAWEHGQLPHPQGMGLETARFQLNVD